MTVLYTVHLQRQQIVTIFENKTGTRSRTETRRIDETYRDLPLRTAEAYRTQFPDANVRIERQAMEFATPRSRARVAVEDGARQRPRHAPKPVSVREEPRAAAPRRVTGYDAVINAMIDQEA